MMAHCPIVTFNPIFITQYLMHVQGRVFSPLARECYVVAVQVYYGDKSKISHCCATFMWWLPVYVSGEKGVRTERLLRR